MVKSFSKGFEAVNPNPKPKTLVHAWHDGFEAWRVPIVSLRFHRPVKFIGFRV